MSRLLVGALVGMTVGLLLGAALGIHAQPFTPDDTLQAIEDAGDNTGVSKAWIKRIVACETGHTFNPYARGKLGERGAVQLYPKGGEWPRFFAAGYTNPEDPYQAVHYLADALFAGRARAWSCR